MNDNERLVLEIDQVTKRFGPIVALDNVSIRLRAGEVLGIIGDNGAGKSTLVSIMSGTARADEGRVLVDGIERTFHSPADARNAGVETIFQNLALIPTLGISENVFLGREKFLAGFLGQVFRIMNKRAMRRETHLGFERLGVRLPALKSKVGSLSGGQRQAVAIGRSVMWGSHIVIMDEPAAALGVEQTEIVLSLVERLREQGVGVILISHNMQHVLRVADRVVVMRLGRKVAELDIDGQTTGTGLVGLITGAIEGTTSIPPRAPQKNQITPT